jgi:hypothetical protein
MQILEEAKERMQGELPTLKERVKGLIAEESLDVDEIHFILDRLLNSAYFGVGENEFEKLTNYYSTFNPKEANSYSEHLSEQIKERADSERKVDEASKAVLGIGYDGWFWAN